MATAAKKTPAKVIPITRAEPPKSWSFSRYTDFRDCPLKFKLKHIDRIKEPPSDAMQKGIDSHNAAEAYVKGTLKKLPPTLVPMKAEFEQMKKLYKQKKFPMIVEDNWAFTKDWDETQWNDWVGCWVRIKLDAAHYIDGSTLLVTDWKGGKPNDFKNAEYMEQMELYALGALLMSAVEDVTVKVRLAYHEVPAFVIPLDKDGNEVTYTRADIPRLKKEWGQRVKPMMTSTNFPPRANGTCRWCYYGQAGKAKGGPGICKL